MSAVIVNNRISGTRITVWDIVHYLESHWSHTEIAQALRITEEQVAAAVEYIVRHKHEVMAVHQQIEDRKARGNPPELEAKAAESRAKLQDWLKHHQETGK
jgi:uncharacterized protein (DUF433 family)